MSAPKLQKCHLAEYDTICLLVVMYNEMPGFHDRHDKTSNILGLQDEIMFSIYQ